MTDFEKTMKAHMDKMRARDELHECAECHGEIHENYVHCPFCGCKINRIYSLAELTHAVLKWAEDRNLLEADPVKQYVKLMEESGELASALFRLSTNPVKYLPQAEDAIGDMTVVLIILAEQLGLDFKHCLEVAYCEIANRKGTTTECGFIKAEDFEEPTI